MTAALLFRSLRALQRLARRPCRYKDVGRQRKANTTKDQLQVDERPRHRPSRRTRPPAHARRASIDRATTSVSRMFMCFNVSGISGIHSCVAERPCACRSTVPATTRRPPHRSPRTVRSHCSVHLPLQTRHRNHAAARSHMQPRDFLRFRTCLIRAQLLDGHQTKCSAQTKQNIETCACSFGSSWRSGSLRE